MPVVARNGAQKPHPLFPAPRPRGAVHAVEHGARDGIVHHIQTGIAARENVVVGDAGQIGKQAAHFGQAFQAAVIAAVGAILTVQHAAGVQFTQHALRKCQLLRRRLSAGKIQLQALLFVLLVALAQTVVFPLHFFFCHILILHGVILPGQYRQGRLLTWCS